MNKKIILLFSFLAIFTIQAQANWIAGDESVSPSSPVPACSTVTASGSYTWLSFDTFKNDNHAATLSYALPTSVNVASGTPSLTYLDNTPVIGAIFTMNSGGWNCSFAPGTIFPPATKFVFTIADLDIVNSPSFTNQQLTHSITFVAGPQGESYLDNARTIAFSTTAVPTVTANTTASSITVGQSITLTGGGASTYSWDSAIVQDGVPFMPPAGTHTYTVTGSDANGCSATSSVIITVTQAVSSGNWIAGDESVSPSSPVPACSTVTASGSFTWLSFNNFDNDNHAITLSYALPACVNVASGTPTLSYLNNTPVVGAIFTMNSGGWNCTFAPGTIFPPATKFIFQIAGLDIADSPSFTNQQLTHSISFVAGPQGESYLDNARTIAFNTTAIPTITVTPSSATICAGQNTTLVASGAGTNGTYTWAPAGGSAASATVSPTSTTTYTVTGADANGCTGTATAVVTVNNSVTNTVAVVACDSYTSPGGKIVAATGSVIDTFQASNLCDSIITYNVTINNSNTGSSSVTACDSYTWVANNNMMYTTSGMYTATFTNAAGCDSVHTLNLTINNSNTGSSSVSACDSYTWVANNNMMYTTSGMYTATFTNAAGCDSVHTLNLTINNSNTGSSSVTACDSYTWVANNNMMYTTSGMYTATFTNAAGCDSVHTLNLTINNSNTGSSSVTACDSYTWVANNNMMYTTSGMYTATFTNAAGCDSVHTLNLTINNSNTGSSSVSACDSYTWVANNNMMYTTSGMYTATFTNAAGCDSVHTLNLTINNSNTGSSSVTACDSYTWVANNNMMYTTSGMYTATFTNAAGCDSVHTLNLTINNSNTGSSSVTACDSYTWVANNNMMYTTSGMYTATFTNAAGCDSVHTLNLTINNSATNTIPVVTCGSFTSPGGKMLSASGTVIDTFQTASNCDSIITYNVTINTTATNTVPIVACDMYTSPGGKMLTTSGSVIDTFQTSNACDSIVTYNVTINNSNTGSSSVTACDSYTWVANNNMMYTTSGMYTATFTNAAGCDSVHTLNLTINNSNTGSSSVSACDSYTWVANNNMMYTTSGMYTATFTNAAGCDSVHTLNLTINNSNTGSSSVTACDSYTWVANNNMMYTMSGMYTATFTNAAGCDSVHTLNLTINNSVSNTVTITACDTYTTPGGKTTTVSTTLIDSFMTGSNCDSITTYQVTINLTPAAPTVSSTNPICSTANGTITVTAPLGANFEYSIDGINYQASPSFSAMAGTYNVTVRDTTTGSCQSMAATVTLQPGTLSCIPNLTAGAQAIPASILVGGNSVVNYRVNNVGSVPTTGALIDVFISKPTNGTLVVTPPAGWTIVVDNAAFVQMTTNNIIQPGFANATIISAVYTHDNTSQNALKSSSILIAPGSGGELITNDNASGAFVQVN